MIETTTEAELLARIINAGIRPHAPELALIGFSGDVAVVVFEPAEGAKTLARTIGWDGESAYFRLTKEGAKTLAGSTVEDARLGKWLGRKFVPAQPVTRVLVLTRDDRLLLNYSAFEGWSQEPAVKDAGKPN
ncbi:MAG TPA: hypothetical protein VLT47_09380 [Anaeromyxobacteraceae bacterium]|nr:hypothetical protein [Anaeromyxobacteraceae bacterium]